MHALRMSARCTFIATVALAPVAVLAQAPPAPGWPDRPLRRVVPFAAGGVPDVVGRVLGHKLGERLGRTVLIDNRLGAAGNVGAEYVAQAAPDGYTLLMSSVTAQAISMTVLARPSYDVVRDYAPVALVGSAPLALIVHSALPVKSVRDFIALARAHPGELNYFSSGTGSQTHLGGALLDQLAGIRTTHVPYKGGAAGINDLLSGQIHFSLSTIGIALPYVEAGRVRMLAVGSGRRYSRLPDLPTIDESGIKGYEAEQWYGVVAPAGTPPAVVNRLSGELKTIVALEDVKDRFYGQAVEPVYAGPQEFAACIKASVAKFGKIARAIGLQPE